MKEIIERWNLLRFGHSGDAQDRRMELVYRVLEAAIDEIDHLRSEVADLRRAAGQTQEEIEGRHADARVESRYSAAGAEPRSVTKWREYLETNEELAARLIPDPIAREARLEYLQSLT